MLCTTVRDKQCAQQLAGSTTGQMDANTRTHSDHHLFMHLEVYTLQSSDKRHGKVQAHSIMAETQTQVPQNINQS